MFCSVSYIVYNIESEAHGSHISIKKNLRFGFILRGNMLVNHAPLIQKLLR